MNLSIDFDLIVKQVHYVSSPLNERLALEAVKQAVDALSDKDKAVDSLGEHTAQTCEILISLNVEVYNTPTDLNSANWEQNTIVKPGATDKVEALLKMLASKVSSMVYQHLINRERHHLDLTLEISLKENA